MPRRKFASFMAGLLQILSVIYFFTQLVLFILGFISVHIDIGGIVGSVFFSVIGFCLGLLIDIAISIEQRLYH